MNDSHFLCVCLAPFFSLFVRLSVELAVSIHVLFPFPPISRSFLQEGKQSLALFSFRMSLMRTETKLPSLRKKSFYPSAFISVCFTYHQVIDNFNAPTLNWVRACFGM